MPAGVAFSFGLNSAHVHAFSTTNFETFRNGNPAYCVHHAGIGR